MPLKRNITQATAPTAPTTTSAADVAKDVPEDVVVIEDDEEECMEEVERERPTKIAKKEVHTTRTRSRFIRAFKHNKNKKMKWEDHQSALRVRHAAKKFLEESRQKALDFLNTFERNQPPVEAEVEDDHIGDITVTTADRVFHVAFGSMTGLLNEVGLDGDPGDMAMLRDEVHSTTGPISHFPDNMEAMAQHLLLGSKTMAQHARNMKAFADLLECKAKLMRDAEIDQVVDPEDFEECTPAELEELKDFFDDCNSVGDDDEQNHHNKDFDDCDVTEDLGDGDEHEEGKDEDEDEDDEDEEDEDEEDEEAEE
jgi:hypothetical protein